MQDYVHNFLATNVLCSNVGLLSFSGKIIVNYITRENSCGLYLWGLTQNNVKQSMQMPMDRKLYSRERTTFPGMAVLHGGFYFDSWGNQSEEKLHEKVRGFGIQDKKSYQQSESF